MDPPASLIDTIQELSACGLIGYGISTSIYGITVLQTYLYYRRYPDDRLFLKAFVATLWLLDTLTVALMTHALYTFFVLNLKDISEDVQLPWSFTLENGVTDVITAMVQCYFAQRIWYLSKGNKILSGIVVVLALVSLALGIEATIKVFTFHNLISQTFQRALVIGGAVQGVAVLCDILITVGLCYYLSSRRTRYKSTNALLDKLMAYMIERGALTATTQALYLIMCAALPTRFFYAPFALTVAKMYVNTTLASLNVRSPSNRDLPAEPDRSTIHFQTWSAANVSQTPAVEKTTTDAPESSGSATQIALHTLSTSGSSEAKATLGN